MELEKLACVVLVSINIEVSQECVKKISFLFDIHLDYREATFVSTIEAAFLVFVSPKEVFRGLKWCMVL